MSNTFERKYQVEIPEGRRGRFAVERYEVAKDSPDLFRLEMQGRGCSPGTYTRLVRYRGEAPEPNGSDNGVYLRPDGQIVMSDTPAEIRDHYEPIAMVRQSGGRVLIHGLGIGIFLGACLAQENVTHVDVVELEADILALVSPHYNDERVTFHQGDAYTFQWPKDARWNVVWHDIWDNLSTDNLTEMARLHRRFGRKADWQSSWGKELLIARRRQEQRSAW